VSKITTGYSENNPLWVSIAFPFMWDYCMGDTVPETYEVTVLIKKAVRYTAGLRQTSDEKFL
jgi:hypothetical protein